MLFHHSQHDPDKHSSVLTKFEPGISHGGPISSQFDFFCIFCFVKMLSFCNFKPWSWGEQASGGSKSSKMTPFCHFKPWSSGEQASGGKRFSKNALFVYKKLKSVERAKNRSPIPPKSANIIVKHSI